MFNLRSLCLASACLVSPPIAMAQDTDPCQTGRNTLEINECGKKTLKEKDKALNRAYQKLLNSLVRTDPNDTEDYAGVRKKLVEAQRSWIKYRDSDCNGKLTLHASGTIRGAVYLGCLIERTEQRTKELQQWSQP